MEYAGEQAHREWLTTQAVLPAGFRVGTTTFDFTPVELPKPARMTLTLIALDEPTADFAAVFTRNAFPGAPVIVGRRRLGEARLGAVVVNNKISNVCAPRGVELAERMCRGSAALLGLRQEEVLPSSTGVIGWRLPIEQMCAALPGAVADLQAESVLPAARGIMTTDLYPKVRCARVGTGSIVGIAKGAGMIEPYLATMLVYVLTDLAVPRDHLRVSLRRAVQTTFNAISIDSDQSTSDTVCLLASGLTECTDATVFDEALEGVCGQLAEDVVRNGEGVKHVVSCEVRNAPTLRAAKAIGKSVINSPLMQCAICGNDPNVGRLVMAVGKCAGSVFPGMDLRACRMAIGGEWVFSDGVFQLDAGVEERLSSYLEDAELYESAPPGEDGVFRPPVSWPRHERTVDIVVDLGLGAESFTVLGCDRTHEYISENADYRS